MNSTFILEREKCVFIYTTLLILVSVFCEICACQINWCTSVKVYSLVLCSGVPLSLGKNSLAPLKPGLSPGLKGVLGVVGERDSGLTAGESGGPLVMTAGGLVGDL